MISFVNFLKDFGAEVGGVTHFTLANGDTPMAIASEATFYTRAVNISKATSFGLKYKALSASSAPTIKIEVEQSDVGPTTEGSADVNFVTPSGMAAVESNLIAETWQIKQLALVPMTWVRLKITGLSGNPADVTFEARMFTQSIY